MNINSVPQQIKSAPVTQSEASQKSTKGNIQSVTTANAIPKPPMLESQQTKGMHERVVRKRSPIKRLLLKFTRTKSTNTVTVAPSKPSVTLQANKQANRLELTNTLLQHWTGKDLTDISKQNKKAIQNLNSAAMMAFASLNKHEQTLATCDLPNCVVSDAGNKPESIAITQSLIAEVAQRHPDLAEKIQQSDGLLKNPILIAPLPSEALLAPEDAKKLKKSGVLYYPRVDVNGTAANAVTTIYLPDVNTVSKEALIKGIAKGLELALQRAEALIPDESRVTAQWLKS